MPRRSRLIDPDTVLDRNKSTKRCRVFPSRERRTHRGNEALRMPTGIKIAYERAKRAMTDHEWWTLSPGPRADDLAKLRAPDADRAARTAENPKDLPKREK
jgi:hypothetical protein